MNMILDHNVITHSVAYIFVNTECKGNPYSRAEEKGADAIKIFTDVLNFEEVELFTNLSKSQVVEKLGELR